MGYTVSFWDRSETGEGHTITAWLWDFGDDGTSTVQNPEHTYAESGEYTVSLTAENDCGERGSFSLNIETGGENKMGEYTETVTITSGSMITISVEIVEPTAPFQFVQSVTGTPLTEKSAELRSEDGLTILQTVITDGDGIATFVDVRHGTYQIKITY